MSRTVPSVAADSLERFSSHPGGLDQQPVNQPTGRGKTPKRLAAAVANVDMCAPATDFNGPIRTGQDGDLRANPLRDGEVAHEDRACTRGFVVVDAGPRGKNRARTRPAPSSCQLTELTS